jgi:hypothetical protein
MPLSCSFFLPGGCSLGGLWRAWWGRVASSVLPLLSPLARRCAPLGCIVARRPQNTGATHCGSRSLRARRVATLTVFRYASHAVILCSSTTTPTELPAPLSCAQGAARRACIKLHYIPLHCARARRFAPPSYKAGTASSQPPQTLLAYPLRSSRLAAGRCAPRLVYRRSLPKVAPFTLMTLRAGRVASCSALGASRAAFRRCTTASAVALDPLTGASRLGLRRPCRGPSVLAA